MEYSVYALQDEGNTFYIGLSSNPKRRLNEHRSQANKNNANMTYCKWRSCKTEPTMLILHSGLSQEKACEIEINLISSLGRRDKQTGILTNHTDGGQSTKGFIVTQRFRDQRRKAMLGSQINIGRKRPDMIERFSKKVIAKLVDSSIETIYTSQREAAKVIGIHYDTVNSVLKRRKGKDSCRTPLGQMTFNYLGETNEIN